MLFALVIINLYFVAVFDLVSIDRQDYFTVLFDERLQSIVVSNPHHPAFVVKVASDTSILHSMITTKVIPCLTDKFVLQRIVDVSTIHSNKWNALGFVAWNFDAAVSHRRATDSNQSVQKHLVSPKDRYKAQLLR